MPNAIPKNATSPLSFLVTFAPSATIPDLSVVLSVRCTATFYSAIIPPQSWALSIVSQTAQLITSRHVFSLGEVPLVGRYTIRGFATTPDGEFPTDPNGDGILYVVD